jgi:ribosome recycling factor
MLDDVYADVRARMDKTIEATKSDFSAIRTGRATPALLDRVSAEAYGSPMPINQLATISVPQPRLLVIQPFDKGNITLIEKAIQTSDLGINPRNDGKSIFLDIPPLTEERRTELVKQMKKVGEEMKVAIRSIRRDARDEVDLLEEEKEISEDDQKRGHDEIQKLHDEYIKKIEELMRKKESDIMEF